ncbi:hypothetical protein GCM10007304_00420 [Rhodococcoides trifolii]|uniref:Uncharacterized protein n=1 Tax=Rhodococcoides trifolii TaxID=908250 RepID=A0A917CK30_9NOCA|nr:hypothetical protein GCM10007304_00420 [Rhodococcus trifolii]
MTGTGTLRPVDGGPAFYSRFTGALPTSPTFFPIALWQESVVDDTGWPVDKAAGINTYLEPTANTDIPRITANGMYAITSFAGANTPTAGYFTTDEADMWAGPGSSPWTGNYPGQGDICRPANSQCGYTVMSAARSKVPAGRMVVSNYGKGVAYWETNTQAAQFVNNYQDVVSTDIYWFTDPNVCNQYEGGNLINGGASAVPAAQCRLATNYGKVVQRVRSLVTPAASKPVWAFIELGHPFTESYAPTITAPQIKAAVWSSLINGARGIEYFNHNFGGNCQTQHIIRDCGAPLRSAVTAINQQVSRLAPVLNAPFVDGLVSHSAGIDLSAKSYQGSLYVMSGSAQAGAVRASITVGCNVSSATVVDENRTIPIKNGTFSDDFADGNAVHIYKIDGAGSCLPS